MWMNESEIDEALSIVGEHAPQYLPYVKFLSDWRDTINSNSDGWPYWTAGTRCASRLMELVSALISSIRGHGRQKALGPLDQEFAKALVPIKSCATRHKLPVPVLSLGEYGAEEPEAAATSNPPAARFLVLSGVGPAEDWRPGDAVIDSARTRSEVRDITIRAESRGAETVLVFEWNGQEWGLVHGEES